MSFNNRLVEHQKKAMDNLAKIRKGDSVKMVNCFEAEKYAGQVFTVTTEPYQISCTWCVGLEGRRGGFDIACLEKV